MKSKEELAEDWAHRHFHKKAFLKDQRHVGGRKPHKDMLERYRAVDSIEYLCPDLEVPGEGSNKKNDDPKEERQRAAFLWLVYGIMGLLISLSVFVLLKIVKTIEKKKTYMVEAQVQAGNFWGGYGIWVGSCCCLALLACCCVLIQPAAAASGIPALLALLNGVRPPDNKNCFGVPQGVMSRRTLIFKWIGTSLSIPSGMLGQMYV